MFLYVKSCSLQTASNRSSAGEGGKSCASEVRRGLQKAGFHVQKQPGFGKKREMLSGVFVGDAPIGKHE